MQGEVVFREASRADLPEVLRLYALVGLDDGEALALPEAERIFERLAQYPDYKVYVAMCDGRIVGTYTLLIADTLAHRGGRAGVIEDVAVDPQWQRRGVGTAMMKHAMGLCGERGCFKAALSSNVVRGSAHAFYESLGFERHGYSFRVQYFRRA